MAQEKGLDLVEIVPDSRPPVCKIMDYGKFKYEQSQKERKNRAASKATEMKEIRLGRSVKIGEHDRFIRIQQARRFMMDGHKVLVTQRFKGREIAHRDIGLMNLRQFADACLDIARVEQTPRWLGKAASIILARTSRRSRRSSASWRRNGRRSSRGVRRSRTSRRRLSRKTSTITTRMMTTTRNKLTPNPPR